jgi:integrase
MESVLTRKTAFTPASLDALTQGNIRDPLTPGLAMEVLPSGKKVWKYSRRIPGSSQLLRMSLGLFPAHSIADARTWAAGLNENVEAGIDPREALRIEQARATMTVARAHELYMQAVREGRASRAKRKNKPRTTAEKVDIYHRDIAPTLARKSMYEVTERDLINLVISKGKKAKVHANRLAAELKVFFGWAAGLRGLEIGLETDPARRLGDLKFPETPRRRKLSLEEIELFLKAVAEEERDFQRGMLLWLLTAARISEVVQAKRSELVDGIWTIPPERVKNSSAHSIALGPWGRSLMATDSEWVFPAVKKNDRPRNQSDWYKARDRVVERMSALAGRPIERFTPHDFRRTVRSNTKRLKVDFETAEAMLNHLKTGLERIYDGYELEDEKAAWFLTWENEIIQIARKAHVADKLGVPREVREPRAAPRAKVAHGQQKTRSPATKAHVSRSRRAPLPA